jgi:hypothetical protein
MRIALLIALLFTFTSGSFADLAHASAADHNCAHHQMDHNDGVDNASNEPCHSEQDQSQNENACDDCCCVHSHSMATSVTPSKTVMDVSKQDVIVSADHHYSAEISGLKRPPRF